MHRVFRSAAVAWVAAGLMGSATLLSLIRGTERVVATATEPTTEAKPATETTPHWVLPQERARALAKSEGRPLLLVSLNGNLDGYC